MKRENIREEMKAEGEEEGGMSKVKTKNLLPPQPWFAVPREKPEHGVEAQLVAVMIF